MDIRKVVIDGKDTEKICENGFSCGNISIAVNNFNIKAISDSGELSFVKIFFESDQSFSLVLSDAWERAYGDLSWRAPLNSRKMPWYFAGISGDKTFCYGVKTGANTFCCWTIENNNTIALTIDARNGLDPLKTVGESELCTVCCEKYSCEPFDALCDFCKKMCDDPRIPGRQIFGGNDWYCNYGDNSYDKILTHTKRIVECSKNCSEKPYMVIDDGWELLHHQSKNDDEYYNGGPWRYANDNFHDMKKMADAIKNEGAIPGIWIRPLWTVEKISKGISFKIQRNKGYVRPIPPRGIKTHKKRHKNLEGLGI